MSFYQMTQAAGVLALFLAACTNNSSYSPKVSEPEKAKYEEKFRIEAEKVRQERIAKAQELTDAANRGDSDAQYELAKMYRAGKGVGVDFAKAHDFFEASAAKGNAKALLEIAAMYEKGYGGYPLNYKKSASYYQLAAKKGEPDGVSGSERVAGYIRNGEEALRAKEAKEEAARRYAADEARCQADPMCAAKLQEAKTREVLYRAQLEQLESQRQAQARIVAAAEAQAEAARVQAQAAKCVAAQQEANNADNSGVNSSNGVIAVISALGAIGRTGSVIKNCP